MKRIVLSALTTGLLVAAGGCASHSIVGHGVTQAGQYFGDVGMVGHGTNLTVQAGSKVTKLSIIGDDCRVTVEEGAWVGWIEFWGNGSTVSIPADMVTRTSEVGANQIIHRPCAPYSPEEWSPYDDTTMLPPSGTTVLPAEPPPARVPAEAVAPAEKESLPPESQPVEPPPAVEPEDG